MTGVTLRPNESLGEPAASLSKESDTGGDFLSTVRRKRWFVSKSELRRIQKKKAIRRLKRRERKYEVGD